MLWQKRHVALRINNKWKYKVDFCNEKNSSGNSHFKERQYHRAIQYYNASVARWPRHMKPLCNRALCFSRIGTLEGYLRCVIDCNLYFYYVERHAELLQGNDQSLASKSHFRRSKSLYSLGKTLLDHVYAELDSGGVAIADVEIDSIFHALIDVVKYLCPEFDLNQEFSTPTQQKRAVAIQLLRLACDDFAQLELSTSDWEFDLALNALVIAGEKPPYCPLCRKKSEDMVKRRALSHNILLSLKNLRSHDDDNRELWFILDRELYFLCQECNQDISTHEQLFYNSVWEPLHQDPTRAIRLVDSSRWLNYTLASISRMVMCAHDLSKLNITDKVITTTSLHLLVL